MTSAVDTLSAGLCPWLEPAYVKLAAALERGQLGHAWLITAPPGVGKINLALAFARRLFGAASPPRVLGPALVIEALRARHAPGEHHPDLHWLHPEPEKETISVDQVRAMIEALALTTHQGGAKVVIVEPAEAMTTAACNALLKTLEEPTANSYLLLLSHHPGRLPATVRSRCQRLSLRPPGPQILAEWLEVPLDRVAAGARLVGEAPLHIAAETLSPSININEIERQLADISEDRVESQAVAQSWTKDAPHIPLLWLMRALRDEVRHRLEQGDSTAVTVRPPAALHNAWRDLGSRRLIEQYERTEKLLNLLGSGLNVELALQALLSGFQMNRGRS